MPGGPSSVMPCAAAIRASRSTSGGPSRTGTSGAAAGTPASRRKPTNVPGGGQCMRTSEYADRGVLLESRTHLEREPDELTQALPRAAEREASLPRRSKALAANRPLAERIVDAHRDWLAEVREDV